MAQYFYLIWALLCFSIWLILFFPRRDTRKEMLYVSILFGFLGIIAQATNIIDWWRPLTITNTRIGIEDFLIGFSIGGISAVIYEQICRKIAIGLSSSRNPIGIKFLIFFVLFYLALFFIFKLGSVYSTLFAYIFFIGYMLHKRRDLISNSIASGFLVLVVGSITYLALFIINPAYIQDYWHLSEGWATQLFLGIPIGEYIWWFLTGCFIGPLYEFMQNKKLARIPVR